MQSVYSLLRDKIERARTRSELIYLDSVIDRHYAAGTLNVIHFGHLDGAIMQRLAFFDID